MRHFCRIVLIFALVFAGCNSGQKTGKVSKIDKQQSLPAPAGQMPQRIILTWTGDPQTTQAVTWRTSDKCSTCQSQVTVAPPDPNIEKNAVTFKADVQHVTLEKGKDVYYHTVNFDSLKHATLYAYRVGDGNVWSEWNQFRTASENAESFKFIYVGDAQNDILNSWSRVIRTAFAAAPDARFIVHAGDLVSEADSDEQWQQWFDAAGWINRVTPSIACIGNHEQPSVEKEDKDHLGYSIFWRPQFAFPLNGPDDLKEVTYYFDYENVRFFVLNGSKEFDEQAKWLDKVLADTHQQWKIAVIHQPLFSTGKDRDNIEVRNAFEPLFDKYNVDVVLQGHDHTYGRTHKINAEKIVGDSDSGTVYCTSVSGPKQYPWNPKFESLMAKKGTNTQLFQIISVSNEKLTYDAFTANRDLFDHFELHKSADTPSVLSER